MVRTQYAKHSPSHSASFCLIPSSSSQCNHNFNYFSFMLIRGGVRKGASLYPPPPAAGRARRALLHLVLLSQRFVWPFSLSIFSFYLLLIFLPLLIQLLLFLACILLISRRAQSKGREKCAVKTCGEKGEMKMKI